MTDPSSRQKGRYKITNPQLSKENFKEEERLVEGPRWVPDTKTDWPTDCRSSYNFDFDVDVWGSGEIDPRILYLSASFEPRLFCYQYQLDRRIGGAVNSSRPRGEYKNLSLIGTQTPNLRKSSLQVVTIPTELFRLI
jgi:hypothetical protein